MIMYDLPQDVCLDFLLGRELLQVSFGLYQTILRLDSQVEISVECPFDIDGRPSEPSRLISLIGKRIDRATRVGEGDIELQFSGESRVLIKDCNSSAESYQITSPTHVIVV